MMKPKTTFDTITLLLKNHIYCHNLFYENILKNKPLSKLTLEEQKLFSTYIKLLCNIPDSYLTFIYHNNKLIIEGTIHLFIHPLKQIGFSYNPLPKTLSIPCDTPQKAVQLKNKALEIIKKHKQQLLKPLT